MKNRIILLVIFLSPFGLLLFFFAHPPREKAEPTRHTQASQDAAVAQALAAAKPQVNAVISSNFAGTQKPGRSTAISEPYPAGKATPLQVTNIEPAIVLQNMLRAVRNFGSTYGGNPVGTNPEITSQLNGNNPRHINFIDPDAGMRINANGELIDPWGTPYFFHQLSGADMEIHSAGPDRIMWTTDDLVVSE